MRSLIASVNGYDFGFIYSEMNTGSGVMCLSENADFTDPGYIEALKIAHKCAVDFHNLSYGLEIPVYLSTSKSHSLEELTHWQDVLKDALAQKSWEWVNDSRETLQRTLDRVNIAIQSKTRKAKSDPSSEARGGYVYLLKSPTGAYKVGRTKNPDNRLATFGVKLPFEVEYICVIETDDMYALERELHDRFEELRINGEWFALTITEIAYMELLAGVL